MSNPLNKLYRNKKVYIQLPSKGKYYPSGINLSVDGELGIMPMTVRDEIMLKSPDSLFNGEGLMAFIKSCVPDIENPEEIPVCDLDPILMAIRVASDKMIDLECTCPHCKNSENYQLDLTRLIASVEPITEDNKIYIEDNNTYIVCRPYSLRSQLKTNIKKFQNTRMEMLFNDKKLSNEEKAELFDNIFLETAKLTVELVTDNIISVIMGDEEVTNKEHISECVENMEKKTYKLIQEKISELTDNKMKKTMPINCVNCEKNFESIIDLNPVTFFT